MGEQSPLRRYRVIANVGSLRYDEVVEIDSYEPGWATFLAAGYLVLVDVVPVDEEPDADS